MASYICPELLTVKANLDELESIDFSSEKDLIYMLEEINNDIESFKLEYPDCPHDPVILMRLRNSIVIRLNKFKN